MIKDSDIQENRGEQQNSTEVIDNIDEYRLGQNYQEFAGAEKMSSTPVVRKPMKLEFFRTHPGQEMLFEAALLETKEGLEISRYLISVQIAKTIPNDVKICLLRMAINRDGTIFIWPLNIPGIAGRSNKWNETAWQAAEEAEKHWVRITSNTIVGEYEITRAKANYADPVWPEKTFQELLNLAFKDKRINSYDHQALKRIRGEI